MFSIEKSLLLRSELGEKLTDLAKLENVLGFEEYLQFYGFGWLLKDSKFNYQVAKGNSGDQQLVYQHFSIEDGTGTIILLHGYFDHVGLYGHIIRHCLLQGYNVLALDFPGHGLSSGTPAHIDSFDEYSAALSELLDVAVSDSIVKPLCLVGQSTGAAVIINSLLKSKLPDLSIFQSLILLAPLVRPYAWTTSSILYFISKWFVSSTTRNFSQNSHDEEFLSFLKNKDPLQCKRLMGGWVAAMIKYQRDFANLEGNDCKLHIIQGTDDTTVDGPFNTHALKQKFPNSHIQLIEGARHHLVNESLEYRTKVFCELSRILSKS